jgi:cell division protein FtsI (penicillin-binding protein 3)
MDFKGEGRAYIPQPSDKTGLTYHPWMAFGYGFGNANANTGIL